MSKLEATRVLPAQADGIFRLELRKPDGSLDVLEVARETASAILLMLQTQLLQAAGEGGPAPNLPQMVVRAADAGHGLHGPGVLVETEQSGYLALALSPSMIRTMRTVLDRVEELQAGSSRPN